MSLDWHSIANAPRVKGHETATAIVPDTLSRFQICEVWAFDGNHLFTRYRVRDAHTVSDAEVKSGIRPRVVWEGDDWRDALNFCVAPHI